MLITPATAADVAAIVAIEQQSFTSPWPCQFFQAELAQPHSRTLVARLLPHQGGEILGYIIFWLLLDELHILNLAISPAWRRQGLARRLLQEAFRQAQAHGCQSAWLEVRPSNQPARQLYASFGFRQVMTRKRYYEDTGEDAIILMLTFP